MNANLKGLPILVLLALASTPARAQDAVPEAPPAATDAETSTAAPEAAKDKVEFTMHGYYWMHFSNESAFPLDDSGFEDGLNRILDHRLRVKPVLQIGEKLKIASSFDVLAGQVAFDTTQTGRDAVLWPRDTLKFYGRSLPRELYLEWMSPVGMLRVGQMTNSWGLGLVANDGEDVEDGFHDTQFGDLVDRVMFVTRPAEAFSQSTFAKAFHVGVAGDFVFRDTNASAFNGDRAFQFIATVFYKMDPTFCGVFVAYRNQKYDNGDYLHVTLVDVYGKHTFALDSADTTMTVAAEGVVTTGRTDAASFERARDGLDILTWGLVARATVDAPSVGLRPSLEFGVASGDGDMQDGRMTQFTMHPDYQVGMILFQDVLGRMSARATDRVSDPSLLNDPTKGYKLAATNGAITNALYLNPKIRWWLFPDHTGWKDVEIRLAFLWARALQPVADPFNTARNGGYAAGYLVDPAKTAGATAGRNLGVEVDAGVSYRIPLYGDNLALRLGLQFGLLKPGDAFDDAAGNAMGVVYKVRAMTDLVW